MQREFGNFNSVMQSIKAPSLMRQVPNCKRNKSDGNY
jgi:hypothetical protein